ncbi:MAG: cysteine synthase [Candidatus Nealsonbacteria bacterium]|nr:cysteine synthase [Candidatus Nealsonbacteria bacterium]
MDILDKIGNTPLVEIKNFNLPEKVRIFAKLEGHNPSGSVKDRIALAMIKDAEKHGILRKGATIIEPSSGNTGISLAMIGASRGYRVKIVMPESVSTERRKILKLLGAEIILVKKEDWRDAAIKFTKKILKENKGWVMLNQYENGENASIHYQTTGKEIVEQMNGNKINALVAGIGTGGTISGTGKRIKEHFPEAEIIGLQPKLDSDIQGLKSLKEGYVPPVLNQKIVDRIVEIRAEEALNTSKEIARKEGIMAGQSSGGALYVALKEAERMKKGNIVVVFPDRAEKYMSTALFQ